MRIGNNFSNLSLCYSRKSGEHRGRRVRGDVLQIGRAENVERIFSIFSVKKSTNLSAKSWGGFIDGRILAGSLCSTSPRTRYNFCGLLWLYWIFALRNWYLTCMQILLYWWTFCMYRDLLKVDLSLCQMRSNKRLVSFAAITVSMVGKSISGMDVGNIVIVGFS